MEVIIQKSIILARLHNCTSVPRKGELIEISDETYEVSYVVWNIDDITGTITQVIVQVK
jgi:hypothetical protein